jgi:Family of unknown function (DUF6516)
MVEHIVASLRQSPIVQDIEVLEVIDEARVQLLKVRAEIIDGSLLYVREAFFSCSSKYSYHWQTRTGKLLLHWDSALPIILRSPPIRIKSTQGAYRSLGAGFNRRRVGQTGSYAAKQRADITLSGSEAKAVTGVLMDESC